jgi:hypothetical protein
MENHPKVGVRMIDVVGGGGGEAEEQPKLDDDQYERKNDARQGHHETNAVMKEIASSE